MPIINNYACAAEDILLLILYLMKQIKRKMFQKHKELIEEASPRQKKYEYLHIYNNHFDPLVICRWKLHQR